MSLFDVHRSWGGQRCHKQDAPEMAQAIIDRYRQNRARGVFRVDDRLLLELAALMPEPVLQRIWEEFRTRRAHGHPRAEAILLEEIVTAVVDAEHFASTSKPINRPIVPTPVVGGSVRQMGEAKVLAGQALTDEEEDAMLWS